MSRYVYEHPAEAGFGEHHASREDVPLADRSAARHGVVGAPQHPVMPGEASMADLDLKHGTEVELLERDDDRDLERVRWTDAAGVERVTSVGSAFFGEHFTEAGK